MIQQFLKYLMFTVCIATTCCAAAETDKPLVHLSFDGNTGTVAGTHAAGQFRLQGKELYEPGRFGQALVIKRHAYDQVTTLHCPGFTGFPLRKGTVAFWFKPFWGKGHDKEQVLLTFTGTAAGNPPSSRILICLKHLANEKLNLSCVISGQKQITLPVPWQAGKWMHIAFTWNVEAQNLRLYLDGQLAAGKPNTAHKTWVLPTGLRTGELWFGQPGHNRFRTITGDGAYDDFMLFDHVLSAPAILALLQEATGAGAQGIAINLKQALPCSNLPTSANTETGAALRSRLVLYYPGADAPLNRLYKLDRKVCSAETKTPLRWFSCWLRSKRKPATPVVNLLRVDLTSGFAAIKGLGARGQFYAEIGTGKGTQILGTPYTCDFTRWHHLALLLPKDGSPRLFIDGALANPGRDADSPAGPLQRITLGSKDVQVSELIGGSTMPTPAIILALAGGMRSLPGSQSAMPANKVEERIWSLQNACQQTAATTERVSLNGLWRAQPCMNFDFKPRISKWAYSRVPGGWRCEMFHLYNLRHDKLAPIPPTWNRIPLIRYPNCWYQRMFTVPASFKGKSVFLHFDHLAAKWGRIFINGRLIHSFINESPYYLSLFEPRIIEISKHLRKHNTLSMILYRDFIEWRGMPCLHDHFTLASYDVWLEARPAPITTKAAVAFPSFRNKSIKFKVRLANPLARRDNCSLQIDISFQGKPVKRITSRPAPLSGETEEVRWLQAAWPRPRLWSDDNPRLYSFTVTIRDNRGSLLDTSFARTFGFRELYIKDGDFYLNGNPKRFRTMASPNVARMPYYYGTPRGSRIWYSMLKQIGYDSIRATPLRGRGRGVFERERLATCDQIGFYHFQATPEYEGLRPLSAYQRDIELFVDAFGNHPSIILWYPDFNTCGSSQDPHRLNDAERPRPERERERRVAMMAEQVIRRIDPSREIFHHAGGNTGSIYTSMNYQSLGVPLREQEDWPRIWSQKHTQPLMSIEGDFPFHCQLYHFEIEPSRGKSMYRGVKKGLDLLYPENAARFFGETAYLYAEQPATAPDVNKAIRLLGKRFLPLNTNYVRIKRLMMLRIVRAWRTYNLSGLGHFPGTRGLREAFRMHWHVPRVWLTGETDIKSPGLHPDRIGTRLQTHLGPLVDPTERAELYDTYRKSFAPLLVYLGGQASEFTEADHAFYQGEKISKSIVVVNDHSYPVRLRLNWTCRNRDTGESAANGHLTRRAAPGAILKLPLEFTAPMVNNRGSFRILLSARDDRGEIDVEDHFDLQVFERPGPLAATAAVHGRILLFDPRRRTAAMLKRAGVKFTMLKSAAQALRADLLIVGTGALGESPPKLLQQVEAMGLFDQGLNLLVFEQLADANFANLVFKQTRQRYTFARTPKHPLLAGLTDGDFINWRGAGDLVPAQVESSADGPHYPRPKWCNGNGNMVASVVVRKPAFGDFLPILDCGFNLLNTPLLELRKGRGRVLLCQMDVTSRYGSDPVATRLVNNLLREYSLPAASIPPYRVAYLGGSRVANWLSAMGCGFTRLKLSGKRRLTARFPLVVVGDLAIKEDSDSAEILRHFTAGGGCVVCLGKTDLAWLRIGIKTRKIITHRLLMPDKRDRIFRGISLADLYFRRPQSINCLANLPAAARATSPAAIAAIPYQAGLVIFCGLDPEALAASRQFYADEGGWRVIDRLLANLDAGLADRLHLFTNTRFRNNTRGVPQVKLVDWRFRIDPRNQGMKLGWQKPTPPDENWRSIKAGVCWEACGVKTVNPAHEYANEKERKRAKHYDGHAWYKVRIRVPIAWKGKPVYLEMGSVDDFDHTFFNGVEIGHTGKETPRWWSARRYYRVPESAIRFGAENWIAIHVFDRKGDGGLTQGPFRLTIDPRSVKADWSPYMQDLDMYDADAFHNW